MIDRRPLSWFAPSHIMGVRSQFGYNERFVSRRMAYGGYTLARLQALPISYVPAESVNMGECGNQGLFRISRIRRT